MPHRTHFTYTHILTNNEGRIVAVEEENASKKKFNILHNSTAPQFFFLAALSSIFTFFFPLLQPHLSLVSLLTAITVYVARISSSSLDLTDALIRLT